MLNVIVIDDDMVNVNKLNRIMGRNSYFNLKRYYLNCKNIIESIKTRDIDIVFIDIDKDIAGGKGIDLVKSISLIFPEIMIIFITENKKHAITGFELNIFDFILKPIREDRVLLTLDRLKETMYKKNKTVIKTSIKRTNLNVDLINWRTKKGKQLFELLYENANVSISKEQLINQYWSGIPRDRAYDLLYTTIYNIRKDIRSYPQLKIVSINGSYVLKK